MKKWILMTLVIGFSITGSKSYSQIYIAFEGVDGESNIASFKGASEISSFSMGATNSSSTGTARAGMSAGKVTTKDFTFTKARGKSSPLLQQSVHNGKIYPKVELRFFRPGSDPGRTAPYLSIILEDVLISGWSMEAAGSDRPVESFSLVYSKIKTEDASTNADGSSRKIPAGWDIGRNVNYQ